jgi:hypothetical protein
MSRFKVAPEETAIAIRTACEVTGEDHPLASIHASSSTAFLVAVAGLRMAYPQCSIPDLFRSCGQTDTDHARDKVVRASIKPSWREAHVQAVADAVTARRPAPCAPTTPRSDVEVRIMSMPIGCHSSAGSRPISVSLPRLACMSREVAL